MRRSTRPRLAIYLPARKAAWILGVPCRPRWAIWTRRIAVSRAILALIGDEAEFHPGAYEKMRGVFL
jgi:hypothetical protein